MNRCVYPANTNGISIDFITKFMYNFVIIQGGVFMPAIKSSADLRNNYNEISTYCHNYIIKKSNSSYFIILNVCRLYINVLKNIKIF